MQYSYHKEQVSNSNFYLVIADKKHLFELDNLPMNPLSAHFSADNLQLLRLSDSTFPLTIQSKLKSFPSD